MTKTKAKKAKERLTEMVSVPLGVREKQRLEEIAIETGHDHSATIARHFIRLGMARHEDAQKG